MVVAQGAAAALQRLTVVGFAGKCLCSFYSLMSTAAKQLLPLKMLRQVSESVIISAKTRRHEEELEVGLCLPQA